MDWFLSHARVFLLAIPVTAWVLGWAIQQEQRTFAPFSLGLEPVSFLEEGRKPFQGNSLPSHWKGKVSQREWKDIYTIGRLIAVANPAEWPEEQVKELALYIVRKSKQYKLPPLLVLSVIHVESSFRPRAISPKGAVGLMQLMPATAQELALAKGLPYAGPGALEDPKLNIELGLMYLVYLKSRFPSNEHVLTAYNMGPGALARKLRNGEAPPTAYYQKVMDAMAFYQRQAGTRLSQGSGGGAWL